MLILELESFPIEQTQDLDALEERLGRWFIAHPFPVRLLAYSRPFNITPALDVLRAGRARMAPVIELVEALLPALRGLAAGTPTAQPRPADALSAVSDDAYAAFTTICAAGLPQLIDAPDQGTVAEWLLLGDILGRIVWSASHLDSLGAFYRTLAERQLRSARYILICWEPADAQPREIQSSLAYATGRRVQLLDRIPSVIVAPLRPNEGRARLDPVREGTPYATVLRSFAAPVAFDATILHPLMDVEGDITIAVDFKTLPVGRAQFDAETQLTAATSALNTSAAAADPATEQRADDAKRVMYELRTQALHQVQVAVLVTGDDPKALARNASAVRDRMGMQLRLEAVAGSQAELLKLFSVIPSSRIDAAWRREDVLSKGVGCFMGIIGYHRATSTAGWLWGTDAFRSSPIFLDPFADDHAAHMVFLGKTGFGKTFCMNLLSLRAAAVAGYRVIWVDADRNAPRVARAVGAGARLNTLSMDQAINPLDLIFFPDATDAAADAADGEDGEDGADAGRPQPPASAASLGWLTLQVNHVISQISLILGEPGTSEGADAKATMIQRRFNRNERGYLERALGDIYLDLDPATPLDAMPTLDDLIDSLERIAEEEEADGAAQNEARMLATTLRLTLYGSRTRRDTLNATGRSFCGHTTVDWTMRDDVVCFDLTPIKETPEWLPLYYAQFIGAVYRYMRDPRRDLSRKTILMFDEFGLAMQIESVLDLTMTISKVARKYGIALCVADQLPITFLANVKARNILDNARIKVIFHLGELPAREISTAFPQLAPEHLAFITQPNKGECVIIMDQLTVPVVVEPTPRELALLTGS